MKVTVLYPQPLNQEKFESDYNAHLKLLHEKTMSSPGMQEVAADATRISTGGAPTILIGETI